MLDHELKSFQKRWYDDLAAQQGISKYNPNKDGKLNFPLLKSFVDILDKGLFDSFGFTEGCKVLDAGCNFGRRLNQLAAIYKIKGTGIDISGKAIGLAEQVKHPNNRYFVSDAEKLPFLKNYFDHAISFGLLEHIPNPGKCLREISRVVKGGGKILIATVNKNDLYALHWLLHKMSFGWLYKESKRYGAHFVEYFPEADYLKKILAENGFRLHRVIYSHSFFLLIYDELIYPFLIRIYKLWHDVFNAKPRGTSRIIENERKVPRVFWLYMKILAVLYQLAEFMDRPWAREGFSYYLYVIAQKE